MLSDAEKILSLCKKLQPIHSDITSCLISLLGNSDKCFFSGLSYSGTKTEEEAGKPQKERIVPGIPMLALSAEEEKKLSPLLDPCWTKLNNDDALSLESSVPWHNIMKSLLKIIKGGISLNEETTTEDEKSAVRNLTMACQQNISAALEKSDQEKQPLKLYIGIAFAKIRKQDLSQPATSNIHEAEYIHKAGFSCPYHKKIMLRETRAEREYKVLVEYGPESNNEVSAIKLLQNDKPILELEKRDKEGKRVSLQEELRKEPEKAKIILETVRAAMDKALLLIQEELENLLVQKTQAQLPKDKDRINTIEKTLSMLHNTVKEFTSTKQGIPEKFRSSLDTIQEEEEQQESAVQDIAAGTTPPISTQLEQIENASSQKISRQVMSGQCGGLNTR